MQIISAPATKDEQVTDLEIGFTSGLVRQLTLRAADREWTDDHKLFVVQGTEQIMFNVANAAWISRRSRTIRTPLRLFEENSPHADRAWTGGAPTPAPGTESSRPLV